jgi:hypothetical protein
MSEQQFYRIRENDKDVDVGSLYDAALRWEIDPEHVEVFETARNPTNKDGARTPIKKFEPEEIKEVLKSARM